MKNKEANLYVLQEIAKALGNLNNKVVFVGGAVVAIYATDPGAEDVRATKDVDITLQLFTYGSLAALSEELAKKRFFPASEEGVICRFAYNEILVDVMSTKEVGWAPSNTWFEPGFDNLRTYNLGEIEIKIFPVSYFLATKFEAFHERGRDARTSHDFEDIVYVLNNNLEIVDEVLSSPKDVKVFLINEFDKIIEKKELQEAIVGHLPFELQQERFNILMERLTLIQKESNI